ncbi:hypothetical protein CEP54_006474 [Fusarium duplospermum]|uniref:Uncharacterized protein n=1 Tax=Fusarium duplospermum TaxID=1325734 RepID=A0A428Q6W7_9HYPO|nr:hypothetical protein CEP54_006474 [Fusarium duplospermum]
MSHPAVPHKRPHFISLPSDHDHESKPPQKRHCGSDVVPGLFRSTSPKVLSVPLPPVRAFTGISRDTGSMGNVSDNAGENSSRSTLPIAPPPPTGNSPEKHERDVPIKSMGHNKSLFQTWEDVMVPDKILDWQKWQEVEPTPRRVAKVEECGLFDETPRHQNLLGMGKTSSNTKGLYQNSKTVIIQILRLWLHLFTFVLGAFIGGMLIYSHVAPVFPAAEWELKNHEFLYCSGDEIKTCSF